MLKEKLDRTNTLKKKLSKVEASDSHEELKRKIIELLSSEPPLEDNDEDLQFIFGDGLSALEDNCSRTSN